MKKLHKKLPFKKVHLPENPAILLPLHAVVTVLVVESICRHSLIAGILFLFQHPYSFLVNALIVGCSYSLADPGNHQRCDPDLPGDAFYQQ